MELDHASIFGGKSFRGGNGEVEERWHAETSAFEFSFEEGQKVGSFLVTLQADDLLGLLGEAVLATTFRNLLDALSESLDSLAAAVEHEGDLRCVATVVFDGLFIGEACPLGLFIDGGAGTP